jgi:hypothetical protein
MVETSILTMYFTEDFVRLCINTTTGELYPQATSSGTQEWIRTWKQVFYFKSYTGYLLVRDWRKLEQKEKEKGALMLP